MTRKALESLAAILGREVWEDSDCTFNACRNPTRYFGYWDDISYGDLHGCCSEHLEAKRRNGKWIIVCEIK